MMLQIINLPGMLFYYLIMSVYILPEIHGIQVVFGLPSQFMEGGMDGVAFGKWLLVVGVPILVNGLILERGSQIELFSRLRMKKRNSFRIKMLAFCVVSGVIWSSVLSVGVMWMTDVKTALLSFMITVCNMLMWETVQVMLYDCFKKAFWSGAAILLLNGGSCLVGLYRKSVFQYMPAAWGMFCRSSSWPESTDGSINYIAMIAASVGVAVLCILITMKREGEEPYGSSSY